MTDKRRCNRIGMKMDAYIEPLQEQSPNPTISTAVTLDISALGFCITTKEKMDVGQWSLLTVGLPNSGRIKVKVEVRWVKEKIEYTTSSYKVGLKLCEEMEYDEKKFIKFFAAQLKDV